jgi:REP element-mobilizing transposase RayT
MPRKARIVVPGAAHHVVQRGHNRQVVFASDEDFQFYLENLAELKGELDVGVALILRPQCTVRLGNRMTFSGITTVRL